MPLQTWDESPAALAKTLVEEAASSQEPTFLVVYAGLVNGRSWCPDCRDAEPFLERKFADRDLKVVYGGSPQEWRKPSTPWRKAPFSVSRLPTLLKVTSDGTWHQLVETDVSDQGKLDAFVDSA